jgi:regulator of protease activity HflC (stomatin/prohibitin superfamily)
VINPDAIVAGFVQGTLRDVVNTHNMDEVMHSRALINQEVIKTLQEKQDQYGVQFVLVQIQSASPPAEVVSAIKNRMVAEQLKQQAAAEASQQQTLADSQFYSAQKKAEGDAYQITTLAEADAKRIELTSKAQQDALRAVLQELEGKGALAEEYIQVLLAQELRDNSKWIITSGGTLPVIDLSGSLQETQPTPTATP